MSHRALGLGPRGRWYIRRIPSTRDRVRAGRVGVRHTVIDRHGVARGGDDAPHGGDARAASWGGRGFNRGGRPRELVRALDGAPLAGVAAARVRCDRCFTVWYPETARCHPGGHDDPTQRDVEWFARAVSVQAGCGRERNVGRQREASERDVGRPQLVGRGRGGVSQGRGRGQGHGDGVRERGVSPRPGEPVSGGAGIIRRGHPVPSREHRYTEMRRSSRRRCPTPRRP